MRCWEYCCSAVVAAWPISVWWNSQSMVIFSFRSLCLNRIFSQVLCESEASRYRTIQRTTKRQLVRRNDFRTHMNRTYKQIFRFEKQRIDEFDIAFGQPNFVIFVFIVEQLPTAHWCDRWFVFGWQAKTFTENLGTPPSRTRITDKGFVSFPPSFFFDSK